MRDIQSSGPSRLGFPRGKIMFEVNSTKGGIFSSDDADHSRIRKSLWRAFSPHALKTREEFLLSHVDLFIEKLEATIRRVERIDTAAESPSIAEIDIVKWFDFIAFDLVSDLTLGEPFGCLQSTTYHPFVSLMCSHVKALGLIYSIRFYPVLYKLLLRLLPQSLLEESNRYNDFVELKVRRRLSDAPKCDDHDIISFLQGGEEDHEARIGEITETLSTLIIAGSETTATVLSGTINHLCKNPDTLRQLVKEVRSFHTPSDMTPLALIQLPFLSAVLKEGLRMCHPICVGLHRVVPPQGAKIDNHWVPGNMLVAVPQGTYYRSASHFVDPERFLPQRWIDDDDDDDQLPSQSPNDQSEMTLAFGVGTRDCIGRYLAWTQMRLILARLLWHFDIAPISTLEWNSQKTYIMWEKKPFLVRISAVQRVKQA